MLNSSFANQVSMQRLMRDRYKTVLCKRIRSGRFISPQLFHDCTIPHGYHCFRLYLFRRHPFDSFLRKHKLPHSAAPATRPEKLDWSALGRAVSKMQTRANPANPVHPVKRKPVNPFDSSAIPRTLRRRLQNPRFLKRLANESGLSFTQVAALTLPAKRALVDTVDLCQLTRQYAELTRQNHLVSPRRDNLRCIRKDLKLALAAPGTAGFPAGIFSPQDPGACSVDSGASDVLPIPTNPVNPVKKQNSQNKANSPASQSALTSYSKAGCWKRQAATSSNTKPNQTQYSISNNQLSINYDPG